MIMLEDNKFIFVDLDIENSEFWFVEDFEISVDGEYVGVNLVEGIDACLKVDFYEEAVDILTSSGFYHLSIKQLY